MALKYPRVEQWITELRKSAERNDDNFVPIFGPPGKGKSTVALQLGRALDPHLTVDQIHFGIANYLANAPPQDDEVTYDLRKAKLGAGRAHRVQVGDEMQLSGRKAMHGISLDFQEFEKDCRGLNLDQIICFPDEEDFDKVYGYRTRFKVVVPERGLMLVYEREERIRHKKGGISEKYYVWTLVGKYTVVENRGPLWAAYCAKKEAHMASLGGSYREAARNAGSGVDRVHAVAHFGDILRQHEQRARFRALVDEGP
jgi:hypothetical protein